MKRLITAALMMAAMNAQALPDVFAGVETTDDLYISCTAAYNLGNGMDMSDFWKTEKAWSQGTKFVIYPMVTEEAKRDARIATQVTENVLTPAFQQGGKKAKIYYANYHRKLKAKFIKMCQGFQV